MSDLPRVLVADPAWKFGDKLPGQGRGASKHYRVSTLREMCDMPRPEMDPAGSILFMWRVAAMQQEALDLANAWGYTVKSELVWIKQTTKGNRHFGMGRYTRAEHEVCLIGVSAQGRARDLVRDRSIRSTFTAPVGRHSEKPEAFYQLVERMCEGPYVELFARKARPGWACYGDELDAPRNVG